MPKLNFITDFESVQLLLVFAIAAIIMALLITRFARKAKLMEYARDAEERRFKLLEMDKRVKLPPNSPNDPNY